MKKALGRRVSNALFGTAPSALQLPGDANVNDESEKAGVPFGDLMTSVGRAVADTQKDLNLTSAEMANLLSNTPIEVIVAEEEVYDDNGTLVGATLYKSSVPAIYAVDAVFYEVPSVRLQGIFVAEEFTAASATNTTDISVTASASAGGGRGRKRKAPQIRVDVGASNTNVTAAFASDRSYGRMRMNAKVSPRKDVLVRKPRVVTVGPRIEFFLGPLGPQINGLKRTFDISLKYSKKDADGNQTGIKDKKLSVETSGVDWAYVASTPPATNLGETNDDGKVDLILTREFAADDTEKKPIPVTVTVRIGFVTGGATVLV